MSMSLYESVVNESYNSGFGDDSKLDPAIEAGIAEYVDDEVSLNTYVGECFVGMMAMEAAIAKFDGTMALKAVAAKQNNDSVALEQLDVAYEGFAENAWEKLKEWVRKAYVAVKNFLIRQWNKLKGTYAKVKAFFGKYGDVLRKMQSNVDVKWVKVDIQAGFKEFEKINSEIETCNSKIRSVMDKVISENEAQVKADSSYERPDIDNAIATGKAGGTGSHVKGISGTLNLDQTSLLKELPTVQDIHRRIKSKIWGGQGNDAINEQSVGFSSIRNEAIEAADAGSADKWIQWFLKAGDNSRKDAEKQLADAEKVIKKGAGKAKTNKITLLHNLERRCIAARISACNIAIQEMLKAAKMQRSYAISACKKAIMDYHTKGAGATKETAESWSPSVADEGNSVDNFLASFL